MGALAAGHVAFDPAQHSKTSLAKCRSTRLRAEVKSDYWAICRPPEYATQKPGRTRAKGSAQRLDSRVATAVFHTLSRLVSGACAAAQTTRTTRHDVYCGSPARRALEPRAHSRAFIERAPCAKPAPPRSM